MPRRSFTRDEREFRKQPRELGLSPNEVDAISIDPEPGDETPAEPLEAPMGRTVLELGAELGSVSIIQAGTDAFAVWSVDQSPFLLDEPAACSLYKTASFRDAWSYLASERWLRMRPVRIAPDWVPAIRELLEGSSDDLTDDQLEHWTLYFANAAENS